MPPLNPSKNANEAFTVYYSPGMTAMSALRELIKLRKSRPGDSQDYNYYIYEFHPEEWHDCNDGKAAGEVRHWMTSGTSLDAMAGYMGTNIGRCKEHEMMIETKVGIPALPPIPNSLVEKIKPRGLDEVAGALARLNKKITREIKALQKLQLFTDEPHTPSFLGMRAALQFLLNDGKIRPIQEVIISWISRCAMREREILLNMKRYPDAAVMHNCHNDEILAYIETLVWYLNTNPGETLGGYGHARYVRNRSKD